MPFAEIAKKATNRFARSDAELAAIGKAEKERSIALAKYRLVEQMGARYAACTVSGYEVKYKDQKPAKAAVVAFLKNLHQNVQNGSGLIFYGTVGTGKDHMLAAALLHAVGSGMTASWSNAQAIFQAGRDKISEGGRESAMLRPFVEPTILGISDPIPPASDLTAYRVELLWRIADLRYRNKRPIWMTLNATDPAKCSGKGCQCCRCKLTDPLWDRLIDGATVVPCFWPSYREGNR